MNRDEIIQSLTDLLTIAKVAMPHDLFAIDPRVIRAQALLDRLRAAPRGGEGVLRVPAVPKAKPDKQRSLS